MTIGMRFSPIRKRTLGTLQNSSQSPRRPGTLSPHRTSRPFLEDQPQHPSVPRHQASERVTSLQMTTMNVRFVGELREFARVTTLRKEARPLRLPFRPRQRLTRPPRPQQRTRAGTIKRRLMTPRVQNRRAVRFHPAPYTTLTSIKSLTHSRA